jgi:uncharacterized membrane-anchored protein YitT (DUF2179 family)
MPKTKSKQILSTLNTLLWMTVGSLFAATSLEIFLIPNKIIDGGIIGISMIIAELTGEPQLLSVLLIVLNLPFLWIAYKNIGRTFVLQMLAALLSFAFWLALLRAWDPVQVQWDMLEVIVVGGLLLGIGVGLIIRVGGCLDGTEIMAILISKKRGYSVGQVVLICNIFVFAASGFAFQDWHSPIYSFMTFLVVIQLMDKVIVGTEETKSVTIMSSHSDEIRKRVVHDLGLGCTVMSGRGGFSGEALEILYVITERLQLRSLKEVVAEVDPKAFVAIENLHEISMGRQTEPAGQKRRTKRKRWIPRVKH